MERRKRQTILALGIVSFVLSGIGLLLFVPSPGVDVEHLNRPLPPWQDASRTAGHTDVLLIDPPDGFADSHLARDYAGCHAVDPRWAGRVAEVEGGIPGAIAFVRERLDLGDRPVPPFMVRFRDNAEIGLPTRMSTYQELHGGELRPLIVVGAEALLAEEYDVPKVLRHEITHCWQLAALGESFYRLPPWVKEGLADWTADKGRSRMLDLYMRRYTGSGDASPSTLVNGLEGNHGANDYGEDYLAFAMVEEKFGVDGVRSLARELFESADYKVAIQRVTGWPWPEFERRARAWATEYVAKDLEEWPALADARKAAVSMKAADAVRGYEVLVADDRHRVFRKAELLELAPLRMAMGDLGRAKETLLLAEAADPPCVMNWKIVSLRIGIAAREKDWKRVEEMALRYLADYAAKSPRDTDEVRRFLQKASREQGRQSPAGEANRTAGAPDPPGPGKVADGGNR